MLSMTSSRSKQNSMDAGLKTDSQAGSDSTPLQPQSCQPPTGGSVRRLLRRWFIQFYWQGERRRESSHSEDRETARRLLNKRLGEIATGQYLGIEAVKVTIGNLIDLVVEDYRFRKLRSLAIVEWRAKAHLEQLRSLPASKFNAAEVKRCVAARRAAGAEDPTINRELSIIRRGFTSAKQSEPPLVHRVPYIPKLEEDNVRQGFLEPEQYEGVQVELPQRLKALFVCAYHVGTRKGELRKVQWSQVDVDAGFIHLTARQTKGKAARSLPIYGEMEWWLRKQWESRAPGCPWVSTTGECRSVRSSGVGAKPANRPVCRSCFFM
jgi:integrase